jgi:hypothetical protein
MPSIKPLQIPNIIMIGIPSKDPTRQISAQGKNYLVTTDPDNLIQTLRLNGPETELSFPPAQWLDVCGLTPADWKELEAWGRMKGYLIAKEVWTGFIENPETGDMEEKAFHDLEDAVRHVGRTIEQELDATQNGQGAFFEDVVAGLSRCALKRLPGWPDILEWHAAIAQLYGREVMVPKRPYMVGIWFSEGFDCVNIPEKTGLLFPERVSNFECENEDGDTVPWSEMISEETS